MFSELELPLVFFTTLSQLAVGMVLIYGLCAIAAPAAASARPQWLNAPWLKAPWLNALGLPWHPATAIPWLAAAAILGLALLASMAHVSYPLESVRTLAALSTSWLSREILVFGLLMALMGLTGLLGACRWLVAVSAVVGLLALFVQSEVYSPPSYPAIGNGVTFIVFIVTAVSLGTSGAAWFAPAERQPLLRAVLAGSLCAALVLFLAAPCIWSSGSSVMRQTAEAYFASPLYWTHIVLGLALPLVVVLAVRRIPGWLPLLILLGALAGRIVFCVDTVNSATSIGGL